MKIIIIEDTVYKCPEKIYKKIKDLKEKLDKDDNGWKIEHFEFTSLFDSIIDKLKLVGVVEFDWRQ